MHGLNRSNRVRQPDSERVIAVRIAESDFQALASICWEYREPMPVLFKRAMEEFLLKHHYPKGFKFKTNLNRDKN